MTKIIDACGLACPGPVLLVKDAVEETQATGLSVLVDNAGSAENVTRFLTTKGYLVTEVHENGVYRLEALSGTEKVTDDVIHTTPLRRDDALQKVLVLISSDSLGSGDDILGQKLMVSYLKTIKEMGPELWQLIFVNGGVKLTIASSPVLQELQQYENAGTIILACGTCLEHFGLTELKQVGGTTNMLDIVTAMQLADKVVTVG